MLLRLVFDSLKKKHEALELLGRHHHLIISAQSLTHHPNTYPYTQQPQHQCGPAASWRGWAASRHV